MRAFYALIAVLALGLLGWLGAGFPLIAGVWLPGVALGVFVVGVVVNVVGWCNAPVPFRITSVAGQQASLPWIRHSPLDSPRNGREAALRVALDVLLFRSLFRNTSVRRDGKRLPFYTSERLLWAAALAFHYALLIVVVRHLRFFFDPPPAVLAVIDRVDGFFQLTVPTFFASDVVLLGGLLFLLGRRLIDRRMRYLSLAADYFPLFLLVGDRRDGRLHALLHQGGSAGGQVPGARPRDPAPAGAPVDGRVVRGAPDAGLGACSCISRSAS